MKYLLDTNICIYLLNGNVVLQNKVKEIGVLSLAIRVLGFIYTKIKMVCKK